MTTPGNFSFPEGTSFETLPEVTQGERAHYARSHWPPGPWSQEPWDKIVWVDPATDLDVMLIRGPLGSWCGYVGVPSSHPFYEVRYSGCVNRHAPRTFEEKLEKAQAWVTSAKAAVETSPTDANKALLNCAEISLKPLLDEKPSYWKCMEEWDCTGWGEDRTCKTPEDFLEVHGGITFSDACQEGSTICHTPKEGRDPHVWWFGFDTAHSMDVVPGMLASSKEMHDRGIGGPNLFTDHLEFDPVTGELNKYGMPSCYRDVAYCKAEVEGLAKQLKEIASRPQLTGERILNGEILP